MIKLCKYSDLFGKVNEGIHSYRIYNIAIIDVLITVIGAYFLHRFIFKTYEYYHILLGLFILSIIIHRLFCVRRKNNCR